MPGGFPVAAPDRRLNRIRDLPANLDQLLLPLGLGKAREGPVGITERLIAFKLRALVGAGPNRYPTHPQRLLARLFEDGRQLVFGYEIRGEEVLANQQNGYLRR